MRAVTALALFAAGMALAACSDQSQELAGGKINAGAPAWQGTADKDYFAPGWDPGDATKWEQQMRSRAQRGQNEYTRIGGAN